MKSFFVAFAGLVLSVGCLVGCKPTVTSSTESITFDTLAIDTTCTLFHTYERPACHLTICLPKPVATTPAETLHAMELFIASLPKDGSLVSDSNGGLAGMAESYVRSYIMQYLQEGREAIGNRETDNEMVEAAATWMNYEEIIQGQVLYNDHGMVSYQVRTESFSGGAHGSRMFDNGVFNLATLDQVTLTDLFAEDAISKLAEALKQKLLDMNDCTTLEQLEEKGKYLAPNVIEATDNFYIDNEGITWTYDPYEIAPYSAGEINIRLTWDEVRPLMLADNPMASL